MKDETSFFITMGETWIEIQLNDARRVKSEKEYQFGEAKLNELKNALALIDVAHGQDGDFAEFQKYHEQKHLSNNPTSHSMEAKIQEGRELFSRLEKSERWKKQANFFALLRSSDPVQKQNAIKLFDFLDEHHQLGKMSGGELSDNFDFLLSLLVKAKERRGAKKNPLPWSKNQDSLIHMKALVLNGEAKTNASKTTLVSFGNKYPTDKQIRFLVEQYNAKMKLREK